MHDEREELIDSFLHGRLDEAARQAFAQRLAQDADLRADLEHQQRIDAALARLFAAPASPAALNGFLSKAGVAGSNRAQRVRLPFSMFRALAAAAAIALVATGVWYFWPKGPVVPPTVVIPQRSRPLDVVYRKEVEDGFKTEWECKKDPEFAGTYWWVLGQGLLLDSKINEEARIKVLGLTWGRAITPKTVFLLARVDDQPVMVFADRQADDPGQTLPAGSSLHLFPKTVGELNLYEVTPLDRSYLLDYFYQPPMDPEWQKQPPYPGMPH
jgi:hypothetical protein